MCHLPTPEDKVRIRENMRKLREEIVEEHGEDYYRYVIGSPSGIDYPLTQAS